VIDLSGIVSPASVADPKIRACLLAILTNLRTLAGTVATETNRAVSVSELLTLGVLRRDRDGRLYVPQTGASTNTQQQTASREILSAIFTLDASSDGSIGTHAIGKLPEGAVIVRAWYDVVETFTSATDAATISLGIATDDPAGVVAAIAINNGGNPWDQGYHEAIQTGPAAAFSTKTTSTRNLEATVAGETLTAGRLNLVIEYVVSE